MQNTTDRIERAAKLIESGYVTPMGEGRWHVQSDAQAMGYRVTLADGCHCHDYTETLKRESPCKHLWAAIGATAALLIHDLRQAATVGELDRIGRLYAEGMKALPEAFVKVARAEYKRRYCQLTQPTKEQRRTAEAAAILVKPQPKSLGCINGIEI